MPFVVTQSLFPCRFLLPPFHVEMCLDRQWNKTERNDEWILTEACKNTDELLSCVSSPRMTHSKKSVESSCRIKIGFLRSFYILKPRASKFVEVLFFSTQCQPPCLSKSSSSFTLFPFRKKKKKLSVLSYSELVVKWRHCKSLFNQTILSRMRSLWTQNACICTCKFCQIPFELEYIFRILSEDLVWKLFVEIFLV